jgi:hypothetical protein
MLDNCACTCSASHIVNHTIQVSDQVRIRNKWIKQAKPCKSQQHKEVPQTKVADSNDAPGAEAW